MNYRGRFAPTPSGPLHFGSVVAALGSWVDARAHGGEWHLRIDDLDPPRVAEGAARSIVETLEHLGLTWDGPVVRQSERATAYADALGVLARRAHLYRCTCTRRDIAASGLPGIEGPRYPGTCRQRAEVYPGPGAWRIDVRDAVVAFDDLLQGPIMQDLDAALGDFVLRRSDGVHAYHLACVVDDAAAGFTHVVRGADLIDSTPRQIFLQRLLDLPQPAYLHLPVAVDAMGHKLSKQTLAAPVDTDTPSATLVRAAAFLGHVPPPDLTTAPPADLLEWAVRHWDRSRLPRMRAAPMPEPPAPSVLSGNPDFLLHRKKNP
jgi:glutamyl-Q tRNA(Asp) synthetase